MTNKLLLLAAAILNLIQLRRILDIPNYSLLLQIINTNIMRSDPAGGLLHFITLNSFGKLILNSQTAALIKELPAPISIATIVGPPSSGKSFLLQHLTAPFNDFSSSHHPQPTQGLAISSKPHLAYDQHGKVCSTLFIDSQGIGAAPDQHQNKLLALILLLSNCILYNTGTPFSDKLAQQLKSLTSAIKLISSAGNRQSQASFHWLLRDYDPHSRTFCSPKMELQNFLKSEGKLAENCGLSLLRDYFPNRECQYLIKPFSSSSEVEPIFIEQVMSLRKKIVRLSSFDIDGAALLQLIETLISALNEGQSFERLYFEGEDCLIRMQCLGRFREELNSLDQDQSMNSIEQFSEKEYEIRVSLKQFYVQKMKNEKQIKQLEEELDDIQQEFAGYTETRFQSSHKLLDYNPHLRYLRVNPPQQKMMRVSLNVSETDKEKLDSDLKPYQDYKDFRSLSRINDSKALQTKLEEYETRLLRYELENNEVNNELEFFRNQFLKSKKELEIKSDQIEEMVSHHKVKEVKLKNREEELQEELSELKRQKLLEVSEKERLIMLSHDKVEYLQNELKRLQTEYQQERQEREDKFRSKINQCLAQISELKESHEEEVSQLKIIYKKNTEKLAESTHGIHANNFYKDFTDQISAMEALESENERYKFQRGELENMNKILQEKLAIAQGKAKQAGEQREKRMKQLENHYESLLKSQADQKDVIILELKDRINSLVRKSEKQSTTFESSLLSSKHEAAELQNQLAMNNLRMDELNSKITHLQTALASLQQENNTNLSLRSQENKKVLQLQLALEELELQLNSAQNESHALKILGQSRDEHFESELAALRQALAAAKEDKNAVELLKEQELAKREIVYNSERQALECKISGLGREIDTLKMMRYELEDEKENLVYNQLQLNSKIEGLQKNTDLLKQKITELERMNENKDQQISFLNSSIAALNIHLSEESSLYTLNPNQGQKDQITETETTEVIQPLKDYHQEMTKLRTEIFSLQQEAMKATKVWKRKEQQFKKQIEELNSRQERSKKEFDRESILLKTSLNEVRQERDMMIKELSIAKEKVAHLTLQNQLQLSQKVSAILQLQKSAQTSRNQVSGQIDKFTSEVVCLKKTIQVMQKEREVASRNFQALRRQLQAERVKSENYMALYEHRMREIKLQNQRLEELLSQYARESEELAKNKTLMENNLEVHFKLSQLKIEQLSSKEKRLTDGTTH